MTENLAGERAVRNELEAQAEIARLIKQCADGLSDEEGIALGIAQGYGIDEEGVKQRFVAAREASSFLPGTQSKVAPSKVASSKVASAKVESKKVEQPKKPSPAAARDDIFDSIDRDVVFDENVYELQRAKEAQPYALREPNETVKQFSDYAKQSPAVTGKVVVRKDKGPPSPSNIQKVLTASLRACGMQEPLSTISASIADTTYSMTSLSSTVGLLISITRMSITSA
jgi:hypothetical protein